MKNKKTIILITFTILSFGLLLLLTLISCNNKANQTSLSSNEELQLNAQISDVTIDEKIEGYTCASDFTFTRNIDKLKAIEALKPYMIFYDGKPVHTDSNIVINFSNTSNYLTVDCTYPNGKGLHIYTPYTIIDSPDGVEFAATTPDDIFRYACVIEKSTCPSGYDVNKTPYYANTAFYRNLIQPTYDLNYNDSLQEECEIWSDSIFMTGNGKYHSISANVRILEGLTVDGFVGTSNNHDTYQGNANSSTQIEQQFPEEEAPDITNPDNPNNQINEDHVDQEPHTSFMDTIKEGFNEFKDNVENNQTLKIVTIACSSVIGIALLYVIYLIIRKLWRVIKN